MPRGGHRGKWQNHTRTPSPILVFSPHAKSSLAAAGGDGPHRGRRAGIYHAQRLKLRSQRLPTPAAIPLDTKTMAPDFEWGQSANGLPAVKGFAKNMKQSADGSPPRIQRSRASHLSEGRPAFDRVKSGYAQLTTSDHKLYSPNDAQITLDVPVNGTPPHQLTSITTSAINFDSISGQAVTDRHVAFTFEERRRYGDRRHLRPSRTPRISSQRVDEPTGSGPNSKPMKVESEHLELERENRHVLLTPWSRLTVSRPYGRSAEHVVLNGSTSTGSTP